MSTRRTYIGRLNGNFVVRTTLPGYDAVNDDVTSPDKFSFSSDWTDLCKINAVGIAYKNSNNGIAREWVPFPPLAYIPYVEVRWLDGNIVYDDTGPWHNVSTEARYATGWNQIVQNNQLGLDMSFITKAGPGGTTLFFDYYLLYVVYKVPVASG